jgi:hypothetical protein
MSTQPNTDIQLFTRALQFVWLQIEKANYHLHSPFTPAFYKDEDAINSRLVELLNRLLKDDRCPWFSLTRFQSIHRDSKQSSIKYGTEKMPDMTVCLQNAGRFSPIINALLVECKVIARNASSKTVRSYVKKGIARFIDKRYAEFATHGMMVAYTSPDFDPSRDLTAYFKRNGQTLHADAACDSMTGWVPYSLTFAPQSAKACSSQHNRGDPDTLTLTHLWLYKP